MNSTERTHTRIISQDIFIERYNNPLKTFLGNNSIYKNFESSLKEKNVKIKK